MALVVGISALGYGWIQYQNQQADVQEAITVEGVVQSTDVEFKGSEGGSSNPSGGAYEVVVSYTYTHGGQEYTSDSVYPGPEKTHELKENAQEVANQYSAGQTVTVHVNREDPSRAFLVSEKTNEEPFMTMGIGALFLLMGILGLGRELVGGESGN